MMSLDRKIEAESEEGRGTTIRLLLPAAPAVSPDEQARPLRRARYDDLGLKRLLIVDDDPGVLKAVKRVLSSYDVTLAQNGNDAIALALENDFDLVLCDLMMSQVRGIGVYARLSSKSLTSASKNRFPPTPCTTLWLPGRVSVCSLGSQETSIGCEAGGLRLSRNEPSSSMLGNGRSLRVLGFGSC